MQPFKENNELEARVRGCFEPLLDLIASEYDTFYENAFQAWPLGELLYAEDRSPLVGAVREQTFKESFDSMHQFLARPGTFEFYLQLFQAIWGDDVVVEFTVPNPGVLEINVEALSEVLFDAVARKIVNNAYTVDELVDENGDNIAFVGTKGIQTQQEAEALIAEMSPQGVATSITLTIV